VLNCDRFNRILYYFMITQRGFGLKNLFKHHFNRLRTRLVVRWAALMIRNSKSVKFSLKYVLRLRFDLVSTHCLMDRSDFRIWMIHITHYRYYYCSLVLYIHNMQYLLFPVVLKNTYNNCLMYIPIESISPYRRYNEYLWFYCMVFHLQVFNVQLLYSMQHVFNFSSD
jgi:hypothetical protein